ncbi:GspH/FimT family pseudopilin [Rhodoferax antarcticus]|uniref:GspH/FimT family pseudopilin n=1 Tax=Rhodoferax antarcticus TaxID=81479 RepID=UPI002223F5B1|nr:GspH/FimT family pseudopilin [Rhodoferax antarcticus]MCW2314227.1 type IV fimbrial biogenesis protein FimT [Rhodoferax antarcticus]
MQILSTHATKPRQSGFTLIELMVTLSVLVVLMALAVPSFQSMMASSTVTTTTNDLLTTLAQARSNAVRRGARVTVCKSANGSQCVTTGDWEQGWIMFNDDDHAGTNASVSTGETITFASPATAGGIVVNGNLDYVSYAADGQAKKMDGVAGFQAGTLRVCNTSSSLSNDKRARDLKLSRPGRVIIEKPVGGVVASCPFP